MLQMQIRNHHAQDKIFIWIWNLLFFISFIEKLFFF